MVLIIANNFGGIIVEIMYKQCLDLTCIALVLVYLIKKGIFAMLVPLVSLSNCLKERHLTVLSHGGAKNGGGGGGGGEAEGARALHF